MTAPDHRKQTRNGYDIVARDYAALIPDLRAETAQDIAMIDVARRTYPQLRFGVGAMEDLPIQDAALGGLLAWYSLIHTAPGQLPAVVSEFARVLKPGAWLLTAFQAGEGQRVARSSAYGHAVIMTNYRHTAQHVIALLDASGFDVDTRLHRSPEGVETTPQAVLLAHRR